MSKKIQIVLGALFGDEGKGSTVQWLATKDSLVVRFSGGAQSGHRVVLDDKEHVCSLVGSGVLKGATTYLHENVYIDPISLANEIKLLHEKGINPIIYVHPKCRVVTPFDVLFDRNNEKVKQDGSCGCGIHAAFLRYNEYSEVTFGTILYMPRSFIKNYSTDMDEDFVEACKFLQSTINIAYIEELNYDHIIFEGSQGLLLDMDNGFMPHCTPSRVGLNGIPKAYLEDAEVFLVIRSYLTRHGNGYEPLGEDRIRESFQNLEEPTNLDTGYQGKFKIGILERELLRDALVRHHLDNYERMYDVKFNLVITHFDCLPTILQKTNQLFISYQNIPLRYIKLLFSNTINIHNVYKGIGPDSKIIKYEN